MTKEEMKEYIMSTGLYKDTDADMFYEEKMMSSDEVVSVKYLRLSNGFLYTLMPPHYECSYPKHYLFQNSLMRIPFSDLLLW